MSDRYIIQWKSLENGRCGRGSKVFSRQEAEELVEELNLQFPQIQHELVRTGHGEAVELGANPGGHALTHRPGERQPGATRHELGAALLKK